MLRALEAKDDFKNRINQKLTKMTDWLLLHEEPGNIIKETVDKYAKPLEERLHQHFSKDRQHGASNLARITSTSEMKFTEHKKEWKVDIPPPVVTIAKAAREQIQANRKAILAAMRIYIDKRIDPLYEMLKHWACTQSRQIWNWLWFFGEL